MEPLILQLTFRDIPPRRLSEVEAHVRHRAARLERYCDRIVSCRVAIERPDRAEDSGNPVSSSPVSGNSYLVRIDLTVPPGHEVVVRKEPGDSDPFADVVTVVDVAFEAAEGQLKALVDKQRGEAKTHDTPFDRSGATPGNAADETVFPEPLG